VIEDGDGEALWATELRLVGGAEGYRMAGEGRVLEAVNTNSKHRGESLCLLLGCAQICGDMFETSNVKLLQITCLLRNPVR